MQAAASCHFLKDAGEMVSVAEAALHSDFLPAAVAVAQQAHRILNPQSFEIAPGRHAELLLEMAEKISLRHAGQFRQHRQIERCIKVSSQICGGCFETPGGAGFEILIVTAGKIDQKFDKHCRHHDLVAQSLFGTFIVEPQDQV